MWRYHTINTIRRYSAINGLTTETYETLHKNWVKNPYRISNKKNVLDQIIKTVSYKLFLDIFVYFFNFKKKNQLNVILIIIRFVDK